MLQKGKTQNSRVWSEQKFIDGEVSNQEDGSPGSCWIHLKKVEFRLLLGQGKRNTEELVL